MGAKEASPDKTITDRSILLSFGGYLL